MILGLLDIAIVLAAFFAMEGFAWAMHRYVMHSRMGWKWHASHHSDANRTEEGGRFELNDLYAVVFAAPAIVLFWAGRTQGLGPLWFAGLGVTIYGVIYAVVHDGLVHQRWPFRIRPRRGYAKRLVQAHRLHHATRGRSGSVSFGFLYAPDIRRLKAKLQGAPARAAPAVMTPARQTAIGLLLAAAIVSGWMALHVIGVFVVPMNAWPGWVAGPGLIALQSWLGAGLFIVAHDAMHGSLAPGRRRLEAAIGQFALGIYCGFPFHRLATAHHAHHRHAGGDGDPDFHGPNPHAFWAWYAGFIREYFGWPQLAALAAVTALYLFVLHAPAVNVVLFWMAPSILSSLQLFVFGTWLPHRHKAESEFTDRHRARTLEYGHIPSLFACFHFGYHLEHHRAPGLPWWRLPAYRRESQRPETAFIPR